MTRETVTIIIVVALFGAFLLLLLASLLRSRMAARRTVGGLARVERETEPKQEERKRPKPVSRREFFRNSLLASLGLFAAQFGGASVAFLWPNLIGGFGGLIDIGVTPEEVRSQIRQDRQPFYFGAGRFYLVEYTGDEGDGIYEGFVADGIMALYQRCVHLGCRVPFCQESQWFECPCHGSKYNLAGEWRDGPAPRGLDRFPVSIGDGGTIVVDTSVAGEENGPSRGVVTMQPQPDGPHCVDIAGEE
jgi:cytochrome b6-f complex iron-sulfur subunit